MTGGNVKNCQQENLSNMYHYVKQLDVLVITGMNNKAVGHFY